ncbi:MAG: GNAT family N-acetyltransferase [Trueperaceae bacterium]|nr:GNAT family N-acetyltransferase [Trueperaceae bacterium]
MRIAPLDRGDVATLTDVMTRAFDDDARRHLGVPKGGPPGYDSGEFLREHGLDPRARAFVAVLEGRPVGAIIVFPHDEGDHVLGCMFTDPHVQRLGIGSALFAHVEAAFPARSWTLETPAFAASNHRFYAEKCGFRRAGERDDPDGVGTMLVFEKAGRTARGGGT